MKTFNFIKQHTRPARLYALSTAALLSLGTLNAYATNVACTNTDPADTTALNSAIAGGGTVNVTGTCNLPNGISIANNVILNGQNGATLTLTNTETTGISVSSGASVTVSNFTITGPGASVSDNNPAFDDKGTLSISNCVIQGFDEGIMVESGGSAPLISNNTISGNTNDGIVILFGSVVTSITGNTITANHSNGITLQAFGSLGYSGPPASQVGTISNNTISGNGSSGVIVRSDGSGVPGSTLTNLIGNTITQNSEYGFSIVDSTVTFTNMAQNIIVGNGVFDTESDFDGSPRNHSYNVIGSNSNVLSGPGTGDQIGVTVSAVFGSPPATLASNGGPTQTIALPTGSIAIAKVPFNATADGTATGINLCPSPQTSPVTTDQRGAPRPGVGKTLCDIGAYETGQAQLGVTTIAGVAVTPPYAINFPSVAQGSSDAPVTVQYSNTGNSGPISVADTLIGLTSPADFSLSPVAGPASLMPTDIDSVNVTYTATAAGTQKATLNLTPTAGTGVILASTLPVPVGLIGTGIASNPTPSAEFSNIIAALKSKTLVAKSNKLVDQLEFAGFVGGVALADFEFQHNQLSGPLGACAILKGLATATDGTAKDTLVAGSPANMSASIVATAHSEIGIIITDLSCH